MIPLSFVIGIHTSHMWIHINNSVNGWQKTFIDDALFLNFSMVISFDLFDAADLHVWYYYHRYCQILIIYQ